MLALGWCLIPPVANQVLTERIVKKKKKEKKMVVIPVPRVACMVVPSICVSEVLQKGKGWAKALGRTYQDPQNFPRVFPATRPQVSHKSLKTILPSDIVSFPIAIVIIKALQVPRFHPLSPLQQLGILQDLYQCIKTPSFSSFPTIDHGSSTYTISENLNQPLKTDPSVCHHHNSFWGVFQIFPQ